MVYRPALDPKFCYALVPSRSPFIENYEYIIKAAVELTGLRAEMAGPIYGSSPAVMEIWNCIWQAALVIGDVTGRDSGVSYLLGICHTLGVPVILMTQNLEDVPAGFRQHLCITYDPQRVMWQETLFEALGDAIRKVLSEDEPGDQLKWPYEASPKP